MMNLRRTTLLVLMSVALLGCQQQIDQGSGVAASAGPLKNFNLITKDELAALPNITGEIADGIVGQQPALSMSGVGKVLGDALDDKQTAALFSQVFIPLNLNVATEDEIKMIPGVDHDLAHEFEEYRPYANLKQFRAEIGKYVSPEQVATLERYVYLPINLNTATRDEIMMIPGVGDRMAHEFEEYRPYSNMAQFRKEIGKYVSVEEVARLERYVTLD